MSVAYPPPTHTANGIRSTYCTRVTRTRPSAGRGHRCKKKVGRCQLSVGAACVRIHATGTDIGISAWEIVITSLKLRLGII